jgi:hypothetical protein
MDYVGSTEDDDRIRQLLVHPAMSTTPTVVKIEYVKEISSLENDVDEPVMPIQDRMVLFYGACAHAWHRERDAEAAARYDVLFQSRLAQMASKQQDSQDKPSIRPSSSYFAAKRGATRYNFPFAESLGVAPASSTGDCDMIPWTQVSLNNNQAVEQVIFAENRKMVKVDFAIRRNSSTTEGGVMYIVVPENLSAVGYSPTVVAVGDTGITLIGAVSGVNIQLKYTSTDMGVGATMWYKVDGPI